MKKIYVFLTLVLFSFSFSVQAKTIDHFYAKADNNVTLSDEVNGSSFLAGESIENTGKTQGVSFAAGNNIDYSGASDYNIIAGNMINIDGQVQKDTIIAGNIINIRKKANLQRDTIIMGSDIEIDGTIGRNITVLGGKVAIKGAQIYGNIRIKAEQVIVDDNTFISGKLSYPKDAKANISQNITNIEKTSSIQKNEDNTIKIITDKIWSIMSIIFIFALLTLLWPKLFEKINEDYKELGFAKSIETFSKGLVFMIIVPVICIMLLLLPFGIPLSLIILALYIITIYLSTVFSGYLLGYKIWQKFINKDINLLLVGLLGFLVLFLLELIPVFSAIVKLICVLIGIGIITNMLIKK